MHVELELGISGIMNIWVGCIMRDLMLQATDTNGGGYAQAFFSANVNSLHSVFILSLNCIHSSACSCGGIPSHLFSISTNVGFEIACVVAHLLVAKDAGRAAVFKSAVRSIAQTNERLM